MYSEATCRIGRLLLRLRAIDIALTKSMLLTREIIYIFTRSNFNMRNLTILLLALTVLSSCGAEHNAWSVESVADGGFTINIPTPIEKTQKTEVTPFGKQVRHFVRWKPSSFAIDKFKLFEVSYTNCNPAAIADSSNLNIMLDSAIEMRKRDFSEVDILESQAIELNGYPGRAFFYDAPKGNTMVTVKICIAGNRLYDLVVIAKKNYSTNTEASTFFNSFKLIQ